MRHEEKQRRLRLKEGMQLGGLITFVVGVGLGVLVYFLFEDEPAWLVGLLPVLVGLVLFVYGAYVLRPLDEPPLGAFGESGERDRRDT
jgi:cadmium resistance protein CadD (predicted permease)